MKKQPNRSVRMPPSKRAWACEHSAKPDFARGYCKNCYDKILKAENPAYHEAQKENRRGWAKRNHAYVREQNKAYERAHPDFCRNKVLVRYGITVEDYDRMLKAQGGVCAICEKPSNKSFHVDHCHETGSVRGLLCFRCNYGLSFFSEDPKRFDRASEYLRRSKG